MSESQSQRHILSVLRLLEEFENQMGRLYRGFNERFLEDEEAAFIFYRLSLDEKAHAALIQYQRRIVQQNPELFRRIDFDVEDLKRTADEVERFMEKKRLPLEEAIAFGLKLEQTAAELHLRKVVQQSSKSALRLLSALGSADNAHVEFLKGLAVRKGYLKGSEGEA